MRLRYFHYSKQTIITNYNLWPIITNLKVPTCSEECWQQNGCRPTGHSSLALAFRRFTNPCLFSLHKTPGAECV